MALTLHPWGPLKPRGLNRSMGYHAHPSCRGIPQAALTPAKSSTSNTVASRRKCTLQLDCASSHGKSEVHTANSKQIGSGFWILERVCVCGGGGQPQASLPPPPDFGPPADVAKGRLRWICGQSFLPSRSQKRQALGFKRIVKTGGDVNIDVFHECAYYSTPPRVGRFTSGRKSGGGGEKYREAGGAGKEGKGRVGGGSLAPEEAKTAVPIGNC